jgi:hypothetical protein
MYCDTMPPVFAAAAGGLLESNFVVILRIRVFFALSTVFVITV